ncbi:MAG: helix-turn-helix domain-containing protein [Lachnospiraceae bacterium]|nr:helix-turn-helix domain-containing protein [Lachnospiraceae bacterium]
MEEYVSRLKSDENDSFFRAVLKLRTLDDCYRFFEDVLTIPELKSISQRWEVATLLHEGLTYTEIARKLNVSTATICRVNKALEYGAGGYRIALGEEDH